MIVLEIYEAMGNCGLQDCDFAWRPSDYGSLRGMDALLLDADKFEAVMQIFRIGNPSGYRVWYLDGAANIYFVWDDDKGVDLFELTHMLYAAGLVEYQEGDEEERADGLIVREWSHTAEMLVTFTGDTTKSDIVKKINEEHEELVTGIPGHVPQ